jgi:hypothetical protein
MQMEKDGEDYYHKLICTSAFFFELLPNRTQKVA